jgi:hypothetical protein
MRLGVKIGPFYASTGTRRPRRGGNSVGQLMVGLVLVVGFVLFALCWPLYLAQNHHGGVYWWGWLLLPPWWFILFIAWGIYLKAKDNRASKDSAPGDAPDSRSGPREKGALCRTKSNPVATWKL